MSLHMQDGRLLVAGQDENGRQALVPDTANTAVTHVRARLEIIQAVSDQASYWQSSSSLHQLHCYKFAGNAADTERHK